MAMSVMFFKDTLSLIQYVFTINFASYNFPSFINKPLLLANRSIMGITSSIMIIENSFIASNIKISKPNKIPS